MTLQDFHEQALAIMSEKGLGEQSLFVSAEMQSHTHSQDKRTTKTEYKISWFSSQGVCRSITSPFYDIALKTLSIQVEEWCMSQVGSQSGIEISE